MNDGGTDALGSNYQLKEPEKKREILFFLVDRQNKKLVKIKSSVSRKIIKYSKVIE
jgi:hypothetical protein